MVTIGIEGKLKPLVQGEKVADTIDLDGAYVKAPVRLGNVLQVTYQDENGVEQSMRFIGAERQPVAGLRRIAWIPSGETPTPAHFLDPAKSGTSMTEAVDVSHVGDVVLGHHIALWYRATLPRPDLFTDDTTVTNHISSFGGPNPLVVDGEEGFYHVTAAVMVLARPRADVYHVESRRGTVIHPVYTAISRNEDFLLSDFTGANGRVFYVDEIGWTEFTDPEFRYALVTDLNAVNEASFHPANARTSGTSQRASLRMTPEASQYLLLGVPGIYGDISGITRDIVGGERGVDVFSDFQRAAALDLTVDGVPYKIWRSTNHILVRSASYEMTLTPEWPGRGRYFAIAIRSAGAALESPLHPVEGYGPAYFSEQAGPIILNGESYAIYKEDIKTPYSFSDLYRLSYGAEPI